MKSVSLFWRVIFASILLITALGVSTVGNRSTAHAMPTSTADCSSTCRSYGIWSGNVHGAQTTFTISNPGSVSLVRKMVLPNIFSGTASIGIANFDICGFQHTGLQYFWDYSTGSGDTCDEETVPSADYNTNKNFAISYYSSNGGGTFFWWPDGNCSSPNPCAYAGGAQTFNDIEPTENVTGTVTNHQVWGSSWTKNQYFDLGNVWHFQTQAFSDNNGNPHANNPPQMFWHSMPNNSNSGGTLYSCDYSTGTTCTLGS